MSQEHNCRTVDNTPAPSHWLSPLPHSWLFGKACQMNAIQMQYRSPFFHVVFEQDSLGKSYLGRNNAGSCHYSIDMETIVD
jgi:hypothetical protein